MDGKFSLRMGSVHFYVYYNLIPMSNSFNKIIMILILEGKVYPLFRENFLENKSQKDHDVLCAECPSQLNPSRLWLSGCMSSPAGEDDDVQY